MKIKINYNKEESKLFFGQILYSTNTKFKKINNFFLYEKINNLNYNDIILIEINKTI